MINIPIITSEDELELARAESKVVSELSKLAKAQKSVVKTQMKYADSLTKMNNTRKAYNIAIRDMFKILQTLVRENRSNVKEADVNLFQDLIHKNDEYIKANEDYINAIKDLAVRKEYLIKTKEEFADALDEVADKRSTVIKKALSVEKAKNKMVEGDKLNALDQELNDAQRDFDRAREILLKKIEAFTEVRDEINEIWLKIKNVMTRLS